MAKICSQCGRDRDKEHEEKGCDLVTLSDGRVVHATRIDNKNGDIKQEIEEGKVKVNFRWRAGVVKPITDRFRGRKRQGSAVLLGEDDAS